MNQNQIAEVIRPHLGGNPEGVFQDGEFDLDVNLEAPGLRLWFDGASSIAFPPSASAQAIQAAVRSLGRRLLHTWGEQYREDL